MSLQEKVNNRVHAKNLKNELSTVLDRYSEVLDDEDLKNALISLTTVGWKQDDGTWRKL